MSVSVFVDEKEVTPTKPGHGVAGLETKGVCVSGNEWHQDALPPHLSSPHSTHSQRSTSHVDNANGFLLL